MNNDRLEAMIESLELECNSVLDDINKRILDFSIFSESDFEEYFNDNTSASIKNILDELGYNVEELISDYVFDAAGLLEEYKDDARTINTLRIDDLINTDDLIA